MNQFRKSDSYYTSPVASPTGYRAVLHIRFDNYGTPIDEHCETVTITTGSFKSLETIESVVSQLRLDNDITAVVYENHIENYGWITARKQGNNA